MFELNLCYQDQSAPFCSEEIWPMGHHSVGKKAMHLVLYYILVAQVFPPNSKRDVLPPNGDGFQKNRATRIRA